MNKPSPVMILIEIALDAKLSLRERLDAQDHAYFVAATDRDSAIVAFAELAHKAPSPSERMNAQDYLYRIIRGEPYPDSGR